MKWLSLLPILFVTLGCEPGSSGGTTVEPGPGPTAVSEKGDDYRSPIGMEFKITTDVDFALEGDDSSLVGEEREERARKLGTEHVDAITRALNSKLFELWPESVRDSKEDVVVMLRDATVSLVDLQPLEEQRYGFTYDAEAGAPLSFLDDFPFEREQDRLFLKVEAMGRSFELDFAPVERSDDAYPRYTELFEGGLDIAIHVGGDHYDPRNDLDETKAIFDELVGLGLEPPVAKMEDLTLESGAFEGSLRVDDRTVTVRVTLFHADMASDEELDKLIAAYKASAKNADVVIYRGHAGTSLDYSGVVVHYGPREAIPATDFRNLELPDKQQIFVFDGCETYTGYADQLYQHENKTPQNTDVITSVNFGSGLGTATTVRALVKGLLHTVNDEWWPLSWDDLLRRVNDAKRGAWTPIYGVHGIDDNPGLSPLADRSTIGQDCTWKSLTDDDCPGVDNLCVSRRAGGSRCAASCASTAACPDGTTCRRIRYSSLDDPRQCL